MKNIKYVLLVLIILYPGYTGAKPAITPFDSAYVDSAINSLMEKYGVPGASLAWVENGDLVYAKGYGYADLENQTEVDPSRTIFRVASVTKLFTSTAMMQLVDRGKINLDSDISTYLKDVGIAKQYDDPVTVKHLLTHTTGLDNSDINDATWEVKDIKTAEEFLRERSPYQAYPPGKIWRYSNFNMLLVGYIIERLSGLPYEEYVRKNILQPLGMGLSSLDQPLPGELQPYVAKAYDFNDGKFDIVPQDYSNVVAAGGLYTTAEDIAKFMLTHLNGGEILSDSVMNFMHRQQFAYPGQILGHALGFREDFYGLKRWNYGMQRTIGHTGSRPGFSSELVLLPDRNTGLFITANSRNGSFRYYVIAEILSKYYPGEPLDLSNSEVKHDSAAIPGDLSGTYQAVDFPRGTLEKFGGFIVPRFCRKVSVGQDLKIDGDTYKSAGLGRFVNSDGTNIVSFGSVRDKQFMYTSLSAYEKVPYILTRAFQWPLFIGFNLMFLTVLISWPIIRQKKKMETSYSSYRIGWWLSLAGVLFLAGLVIATEAVPEGSLFDHGVPILMKILMTIPLLIVVGLIWGFYNMIKTWVMGTGPVLMRIFYVVQLMAVTTFLWWAHVWNMLGYHF